MTSGGYHFTFIILGSTDQILCILTSTVCFKWAYSGNGTDAAASIAPTSIRHWLLWQYDTAAAVKRACNNRPPVIHVRVEYLTDGDGCVRRRRTFITQLHRARRWTHSVNTGSSSWDGASSGSLGRINGGLLRSWGTVGGGRSSVGCISGTVSSISGHDDGIVTRTRMSRSQIWLWWLFLFLLLHIDKFIAYYEVLQSACLPVCLSVVYASISQKPHVLTSPNSLGTLPVSIACAALQR